MMVRDKKKRMRKEVVVAKFYGHVPGNLSTANQKRQLSQSLSAAATFHLKFRHFILQLTDNHSGLSLKT